MILRRGDFLGYTDVISQKVRGQITLKKYLLISSLRANLKWLSLKWNFRNW